MEENQEKLDKVANNKIFDELKIRIIEMKYSPGDMLNEKALAEEFEVSRTPVREALIKLSQIGLVDIRPRIGTYVSQIDLISVKHAYEIKKNLEGLAAELAAQRASSEEIYELFDILHRFESYDVVKDYKFCIQDDQRFHMVIRNASKNPMLIEILDELNTKTARFLQHIHYILDDYEWFYNSLMKMAEAIRDKDPQRAKEATEEHTNKYLLWLSKNFFM